VTAGVRYGTRAPGRGSSLGETTPRRVRGTPPAGSSLSSSSCPVGETPASTRRASRATSPARGTPQRSARPTPLHRGRGARRCRRLHASPNRPHDAAQRLPTDVRVLHAGNRHTERVGNARSRRSPSNGDAPVLRRDVSITSTCTLILKRFNPDASSTPTPTSASSQNSSAPIWSSRSRRQLPCGCSRSECAPSPSEMPLRSCERRLSEKRTRVAPHDPHRATDTPVDHRRVAI